jgi:Flp pilus assembly protein TadD
MVGGDYKGAISVLRQAVAAAPHSSLTYAYALFDLGRSLRLAGDPRAAVPILWRRLQIPNQTDVVRSELTLALQALGSQVSRSGQAGDGGPGANSSATASTGPGPAQGD